MSNPILNKTFEREGILEGQAMTVTGAMLKSLFLFASIVLSAGYTWSLCLSGFVDKADLLMKIGFAVSLIFGLVAIWVKPKITPILAILYSVGEGFVLGGISYYFESLYHGIVPHAVVITFIVTGTALVLYLTRLIRVTEKLWSIMITATASVAVIYLIQIIATMFGRSIPGIFAASPIGIGFSILVILIAAFNLILDFHVIESGAQNRLPKLYEWIGALGLMFTLVWLYFEILNLLTKIAIANNR